MVLTVAEKFNLADALKNVSELDTAREQIEYINIDLLESDERNFYQLSDLEQLVSNIELIGLQQPIRVRPHPEQEGKYIVVSGHRRRAAMQLLADEGNDAFREAPCIVEASAASDAMQELRLIYANSDTRRMSPAEIAKQVERVEALLYQLKEEGVEFPGRMRDHVAEACKVSKSKIARLKVIRDNLAFEYKYLWEAGELSEAVAYALAQQPQNVQRDLHTFCASTPKQWSEWSVKSKVEQYEKIKSRECKHASGGKCDHCNTLLQKLWDNTYSYRPCDRVCCADCSSLGSCKNSCSHMADRAKKIKTDAREAKRQEKLAQEAKDAVKIAEIQELWIRFGFARQQAKKTVEEAFAAMGRYYYKAQEAEFIERENASAKTTANSSLPYAYNFDLSLVKALVGAADCLGCSVDFLLRRSDEPNGTPKAAGWMPSEQLPKEPCEVLADFDLGADAVKPFRKLCYFDGTQFRFGSRSAPGEPISLSIIRWLPVPDVKEDAQ